MVSGPARPCSVCGEHHFYGPEDVNRYVHTLRTIAEMAERSDSHPDMELGKIAREALGDDSEPPFNTPRPDELSSPDDAGLDKGAGEQVPDGTGLSNAMPEASAPRSLDGPGVDECGCEDWMENPNDPTSCEVCGHDVHYHENRLRDDADEIPCSHPKARPDVEREPVTSREKFDKEHPETPEEREARWANDLSAFRPEAVAAVRGALESFSSINHGWEPGSKHNLLMTILGSLGYALGPDMHSAPSAEREFTKSDGTSVAAETVVGLCLELAWGIIANAYGGNWDEADPQWREAAERWRDDHYHPFLASLTSQERADG